VSGILETCRMESLCMPDLEYLLDESPCEPYPYERNFEEAKNHPVMVVHASSSTGLPKPILWTNWTLNTGDPRYIVHPIETRPVVWGGIFENCRRVYMALPVHYGAGIGMAISATCFDQTTILLGPPDCVSADVLGTMLDVANIDAVAVVPETLEDAANRRDVLPKLEKLSFVAVIGGKYWPG
jgi:acyl-coenzyme A synthetase/AMP-(fatty) acid ligase